ncbi:RNA methyltransferase [Mycoplasma suis]|uniref:tRNA (guanine-N(1)-)-methyltransferase n=2 Tax=Mycoplasma suis TaxID=57372 RepID=F0QR66_MYCSL|nr:23S rRNA (pseudouridine(1915)-N(3))-methyltransferase RlmH [Mycoplasma suis]ADX97986.1 tRNA (guanine-N(1)-)-methyltransferase [Mycoplasma suis str. Illinois]CBZ40483.1 tRNA (guanine-N(1)-)-methyltransferase [Mycoplasma suis KI3806]
MDFKKIKNKALSLRAKRREFYFITLFPVDITNWLIHSITLKSIYRANILFKIINLRQKWNQQVDYTPYGGSSGMVISVEPIYNILKANNLLENTHIILLCPRGEKLTQTKSRELERISETKNIVFICGHYEGIDERIRNFVSEAISIGDYIISSGTLAASIVLESVVRLVPDVISAESLLSESFNTIESDSDLDFPVYAPPKNFMGYKVPDVLFSGNQSKIKQFREESRIKKKKP